MTTTAPDTREATQELWKPPGTTDPAVPGAFNSSDMPPPPPPPNWALGVDEPAQAPHQRRINSPRKPLSFEVRLLIQILLMLCVGVFGLTGFLLMASSIQQNNAQDRLYATFREQLALQTAPTGGSINPGSPVALLNIPNLRSSDKGTSLNQVVVQGTASGDLETGPGHQRNTPLPGQAGWSVIYGKSLTFGEPFREIDRLRAGDEIKVTTAQGDFSYRVSGVRRPGDSVPDAVANGAGRLTLVTSDQPNLFGHWNTLFVDADLVDRPQPTPPGQPGLIPPEEQLMAPDTAGGNLRLVLWLQALGLVFAGIVWARQRWGKRETMVAGVPVVLAVVWNLYETVGRLLPNLM